MSFNQVWSGSTIVPTAGFIVCSDTEHLIVVETLLPKGSILDVQNEDKSLISRVSIEVERIGLVKTESGFIVRSVETGLGR